MAGERRAAARLPHGIYSRSDRPELAGFQLRFSPSWLKLPAATPDAEAGFGCRVASRQPLCSQPPGCRRQAAFAGDCFLCREIIYIQNSHNENEYVQMNTQLIAFRFR